MYCHNSILITKFQIIILNIEYVITNSHLGSIIGALPGFTLFYYDKPI